jgi:hypothetical protein
MYDHSDIKNIYNKKQNEITPNYHNMSPMVTVNYKGRVGNNMIQYMAAYMLAKKHNFILNAQPSHNCGLKHHPKHGPTFQVNSNWGEYFKFPLYSGGTTDKANGRVNIDGRGEKPNTPYIHLLESKNLPPKHYHLDGFFQDSRLLYKYRHEIRDLFTLEYDDKIKSSEVFVAYRIGDMEGNRVMLPKEYYMEALDIIKPSGGYITSDTPLHPFVVEISKKYNLQIYGDSLEPLKVIDFAKNFNNLVLSEGSFNFWMGFLSKGENIIINDRPWKWFGKTLFDFPTWRRLSWDYEDNTFDTNYRLTSYKPIKLINN